MKKYLLALFLTFATFAVHAASLITYPKDTAYLHNIDVLKLNDVQNTMLMIYVPYPGSISNNCNLLIRTNYGQPLQTLLDRLIITPIGSLPALPEVKGSIIIPLALEGYLGGIMIETKDGKSIAENVAAAYPPMKKGNLQEEVGMLAGICHRKFP